MAESDNHFKVPLKQWRKWNAAERKVFNETHDEMLNNQKLFMHPKAAAIPMEHWKTIAWNAAWIAACAARDAHKNGDVVEDIKPRTGRVTRTHVVKRTVVSAKSSSRLPSAAPKSSARNAYDLNKRPSKKPKAAFLPEYESMKGVGL